MQWLNPSGAWAFLGLLPVIALYLLRKKAKRTPVPSLLLWRRTEEKSEANKPFHWLKNQLLLWLQLLLVVLLAIALMRPASIGGIQGEAVFVFDLSMSMQTQSGNGSRLDIAKDEALQMLDGMHDEDAVSVLLAGQTLAQAVMRSNDHAAVRRVIDGLTAQNGTADVEGAVGLALAMRRDLPQLRIVVFSDSYAGHADVQVVSVGQSVSNRSVRSLRLSEQDGAGVAFARVQNIGEATEAEMECYADGVLCDVRTVSLEANSEQSVRFSIPSGASRVMVHFTEPDALAADDARYAAAKEASSHSALLVTEGNVFWERALALDSALNVTRTTPDDASAAEGYDLYIYDCSLPDTLPESGAILAICPTGEVLGIVPGDLREDAGTLRASGGETAASICEHLLLTDIALRAYRPLTGGEAVISTNQNALLSVSERGGRRAAVLGFDLHDSNLPLKADFPILVQNLLAYLLPDTQAAVEDSISGESVRPVLHERTTSASVFTPSGREVALVGGMLTDTNEIGLYTLVETYADDTQRQTVFAVHPPSDESDTLTLNQSTDGSEQADQGMAGTGREWTPWVLLLCFVVLMLEWGVSRRGA